MNEQLLTRLKHDIAVQYGQKYGAVAIDFDELAPEEEQDIVRLAFTISKDQSFVTRYYGRAAYQDHQWILDVRSI